MLNEFYKYIANNTVSFFQSRQAIIRPGERYCLRLDTEEMVAGVDQALRAKTSIDGIQGNYQYGEVYDTFTIKLSASVEVVVASRINGMTDDFLATLRNAELTEKHFPILMITHSPIDTITSGTGDLAANGMPFHAASIISKIKEDIRSAELSVADRILLELEMNQSKNELPFIIDTPFARIDTEHRANITEYFFKKLTGQLLILSTDEELSNNHLEAMRDQISHVYMLEYGQDKRTHIRENQYFEV